MKEEELIITAPAVVGKVFMEQMQGLDHEEVWCLFLASNRAVIAIDMLSKGTLTETSIDCRTVLRQTLLHNAAGLILIHNHPSGNPEPSVPDIRFTKKLQDACRLMDINLVDHIIISDSRYFSFALEKTEE